jgi:N-dimethylarginine dimethylaminohydrolase
MKKIIKKVFGMLGELGRLGYMGIETDIGEFMKAGGGIHCLTSVLEED